MARIKICPYCGTHNSPNSYDCIQCDMDISCEKSIEEESLQVVSTPKDAGCGKMLVRICTECGFSNPLSARKCEHCKTDLDDVIPTEFSVDQIHNVNIDSVDGLYSYKISEQETVLGRESAMCQYLSSKAYVSRYHCKLIYVSDELLVDDLKSTNGTYVNGHRIAEPTKLVDGDELSLGGIVKAGVRQKEAAYFIVRLI